MTEEASISKSTQSSVDRTSKRAQKVTKSDLRPIEECEEALANVMHELTSYSYLLRWLGTGADGAAENLYGLGLSLERLSREVFRATERLGRLRNLTS